MAEAVDSVFRSKRDDVDLIVVDDGSTDERTRSEMDALRAKGIRVLRQENQGLAAARNAGIRASSGEYVLPLDADNRVRPAYFEHGIRILDADPSVGVVYGDAEYMGDRSGRWHVGPFDRERLLQWNFIDACAFYRRSIWEANGGYDGTMPVQGLEDWDFWLSTLESGWQFAYVPEIVFDYRVSADSMVARSTPYNAQTEAFVARKHGALYRRTWLAGLAERESLKNLHESERESGWWTFRNLRRLATLRVKQRLGLDSRAREPRAQV